MNLAQIDRKLVSLTEMSLLRSSSHFPNTKTGCQSTICTSAAFFIFLHNFEAAHNLTLILNCSLCWRRSQRFTDPLFPLFRLIHLGRAVGADEWTLMKREWSPAVSITTQTAALIVSGLGAEPVARILAGSGPEVPLLYWTTRLTLR